MAFRSKYLRIKYPELSQQYPELAKLLLPGNKDVPLYSETTFQEFHRLLLELMKHFQDDLEVLVKCMRRSSGFKAGLERLTLTTYALQRIVRGAALRMHLQTK
jgi:hypothetical protein